MILYRKSILKTNFQLLFTYQHKTMCKMKHSRDMISSPDPISNLRQIKYAVPEDETEDEKKLRKHRQDLQTWNEIFWKKHNLSFIQKKKEFEEVELSKKKGESNELLSADEISVFYKDFLDKNWKTHMKYLLEWYKRNIYVTYLHFRVNIFKIFKKR